MGSRGQAAGGRRSWRGSDSVRGKTGRVEGKGERDWEEAVSAAGVQGLVARACGGSVSGPPKGEGENRPGPRGEEGAMSGAGK